MNNEELLNRYSWLIIKGEKYGLTNNEAKEQIQNRKEIVQRMMFKNE